jgi:hypothetical protein
MQIRNLALLPMAASDELYRVAVCRPTLIQRKASVLFLCPGIVLAELF